MENTGSQWCVHWEEWMNKLKAMAFLAIFKAMRHYWFLRRKRILNVSRDPGFLSLSILTLFLQLLATKMMRDKQQRPTLALARHSSFWNQEHSSRRTPNGGVPQPSVPFWHIAVNQLFSFFFFLKECILKASLSVRMEAEDCCKDGNLSWYLEETSKAFCYRSRAHFHTNFCEANKLS